MHIHVLGAGAGGGFPQWNCNCYNCDGLRKGTIKATKRTQSSICVSGDGVNWVLFNASPDVLQQIQEFGPLQPGRAVRDSGIVGIVLIDAQIDHTTGLLMLREGQLKREIYCTDMVYQGVRAHHFGVFGVRAWGLGPGFGTHCTHEAAAVCNLG